MQFFHSPETEKLVFTTEQTPASLRWAAGQYARIEVVPTNESGRADLVEVLHRLPPLGVRHLLLEGGGELNFSMLQAGLIDELFLTICPFVFGGRTAPTGFDGVGFARHDVRKLALKSHRVSSRGEVFLRYDVLPEAPSVTVGRLFPGGFEIS
jgi:5-amino-6-(5-phosphoribosylamino)uracil reductase